MIELYHYRQLFTLLEAEMIDKYPLFPYDARCVLTMEAKTHVDCSSYQTSKQTRPLTSSCVSSNLHADSGTR